MINMPILNRIQQPFSINKGEKPLTKLYRAASAAMLYMPKIEFFALRSDCRSPESFNSRKHADGVAVVVGQIAVWLVWIIGRGGDYGAHEYTEFEFTDEVLQPWRNRFGENCLIRTRSYY